MESAAVFRNGFVTQREWGEKDDSKTNFMKMSGILNA